MCDIIKRDDDRHWNSSVCTCSEFRNYLSDICFCQLWARIDDQHVPWSTHSHTIKHQIQHVGCVLKHYKSMNSSSKVWIQRRCMASYMAVAIAIVRPIPAENPQFDCPSRNPWSRKNPCRAWEGSSEDAVTNHGNHTSKVAGNRCHCSPATNTFRSSEQLRNAPKLCFDWPLPDWYPQPANRVSHRSSKP